MTRNNDANSSAQDYVCHGDDARHLAYGQLADEIQAILKAGQQPDAQMLADKHPQLAAEVHELIPALTMLEEIGEEPAEPTDRRDAPKAVLGDFRILREVGRGGMGVVYEAQQVSMSRRIALKVLPFAAVLDQKLLRRFHSEAQIAGQLVHQNIVPVHAVGCERGVHYYAMQYVDGRTLAELINTLRQPKQGGTAVGKIDLTGNRAVAETAAREKGVSIAANTASESGIGQSRNLDDTSPVAALTTARSCADAAYIHAAAELTIQVAHALNYAHNEGVVHRDIKPSNLMVDSQGKIWVTDFGLAHIETGPSVTLTGDILGTLRYMSPEQALAQRVVVDYRTDIYSLGLTFYELLTQRPAFTGANRQELLRQISFEEPPRPRHLNKSIPLDLETIVIKCIEKNPVDRFATARELAEDLQRFLDDRPIQARRPSLALRGIKWCRRHRSLVATVVSSLFVVLFLTAIGLAVVAMRLADIADQERSVATREKLAKVEVAQLLARTYVDKAQALCETGEIATGMLWLVHSLKTVPPKDDVLQRMIRNAHAAWEGQLPALILLLDQDQPTNQVKMSADNSRAFVAYDDGSLAVWDSATGQPIATVARASKHTGQIFSLAVSPDDKYLATASIDGTARLWDAETLKAVGSPLSFDEGDGVTWWVITVVFSPDGKEVVVGGGPRRRGQELSQGKIVHWDIKSGQQIKVRRFARNLRTLRFTDKGLLAILSKGQSLQLWDVNSEQPISPAVVRRSTWNSAISPDGTKFAGSGPHSNIGLWDATTGERLLPDLDHGGLVYSIEFSHDSTQLLSAGLDQAARLWDLESGRMVAMPLRHHAPARCANFSPDGKYIITGTGKGQSGPGKGSIRIWEAVLQRTESMVLKAPEPIRTAKFCRQGLRVLTNSDNGYLLRDADTLQPIGAPINDIKEVKTMRISDDGSRLLIIAEESQVRNAETGELISRGRVGALRAISSTGRYLLSYRGREVSIFDANTFELVGEPVRLSLPHRVTDVKFHPNETQFLTGCFDGNVRVWDPKTHKQVGAPLQHVSEVTCFACCGTRVIVGCGDGSARLWDLASHQPVGPTLQHKHVISRLDYSRDGSIIGTSSVDGIIRLWDGTTLNPIGPPIPAGGWSRFSLSTDGKRLMKRIDDHYHVWRIGRPSWTGSPEDLRLWTEIATGWSLDEKGGVHVLSSESWRSKREKLIQNNVRVPIRTTTSARRRKG